MIDWSEQHLMVRDAVRRFIAAEIKPNLEEIENGDKPPYEIMRKLAATFGLADLARARFERRLAAAKGTAAPNEPHAAAATARGDGGGMQLILISELSRYCPGMVTAMGVSAGLTAGAILSRGTRSRGCQK